MAQFHLATQGSADAGLRSLGYLAHLGAVGAGASPWKKPVGLAPEAYELFDNDGALKDGDSLTASIRNSSQELGQQARFLLLKGDRAGVVRLYRNALEEKKDEASALAKSRFAALWQKAQQKKAVAAIEEWHATQDAGVDVAMAAGSEALQRGLEAFGLGGDDTGGGGRVPGSGDAPKPSSDKPAGPLICGKRDPQWDRIKGGDKAYVLDWGRRIAHSEHVSELDKATRLQEEMALAAEYKKSSKGYESTNQNATHLFDKVKTFTDSHPNHAPAQYFLGKSFLWY